MLKYCLRYNKYCLASVFAGFVSRDLGSHSAGPGSKNKSKKTMIYKLQKLRDY